MTLKMDEVLLKEKLGRLYFSKRFFLFLLVVSGTKYSTRDCPYIFCVLTRSSEISP